MLAIADAFDSMTTDHVYRRALSHERAMNELFGCAGAQFDPDLVQLFHHYQNSRPSPDKVVRHWLHDLDPSRGNSLWQLNRTISPPVELIPEALFQQKLLDNMHDAVLFVDRNMQIMLWNRGAERLTGIASASVYQRTWVPSMVQMRDENGNSIVDAECPVTYAVQTGVQSLRRLLINGPNSRTVAVDLHAVPVAGQEGTKHGAAVLLHDASPEASLEKRCQSLHERATKDPLTQVANRAEFDRAHEQFVQAHLERKLPCSLLVSTQFVERQAL
jgi:PAS domain S-box-containing protein